MSFKGMFAPRRGAMVAVVGALARRGRMYHGAEGAGAAASRARPVRREGHG